MRILLCSAVLALALAELSCSRRSDHKSEVRPSGEVSGDNVILAVVGGKEITLAEFRAQLNRRFRASAPAHATEEQKRALLEEMIRFEVLVAKAKAAGYDRDPEIQSRVNQFIVARFQEDQMSRQVARTTPSDAETRKFYEQNKERFTTPDSIRAALIYFKCSAKATDEKRQQAKQQAASILAEARKTDAAGFTRLAQEFSQDQATRYVGGDTGWLARGSAASHWEEAVLNAAFGLSEPGHLSPLVETPGGFYIVRLVERKPSAVRPLEQVKDAVAHHLAQQQQRQRQLDFHEEMRRGLKIETYPELLRLIPAPEHASETKPPPLPGS